jgi:DNA-binding CsgD family transcriptional regulator
MSFCPLIRGECEAIRLLRLIVEGNDGDLFRAIDEAKLLLRALRTPKNLSPVGRRVSAVTVEQLRQMAQLDAEGKLTQQEIADRLGVNRYNVNHHLRPSKAMLAALLEDAA